MLSKVMDDPTSAIIISAILGLGLAAMFRVACKDGSCIVIKGPPTSAVENTFYKIEDQCYKYTPSVVDCKGTTGREKIADH